MNIKKIGLTALGTSLIATSAFAGAMDVTGSAGITLANQDKKDKGNGFTMTDEITFTGTGELDNGFTVTVSMQLDNNASATSGQFMDNRSVAIDTGDFGKVTFYGHGADSALSMKDDTTPTAYGEAWDVLGTTTTGGAGSTQTAVAKKGSIGGATADNMIGYTNSSLMDGLTINASYMPSDGTVVESVLSTGIEYTGVEGLTVGYATDENGLAGTSGIDYEVLYAKYAFGPVTAGVTMSEQDANGTTNDDEFEAMGITYAVNDDLTIGYNTSTYDDANNNTDEESTNISFSYTMGGMTLAGAFVTVDNQGADSAAINDTSGYELDLSFAF